MNGEMTVSAGAEENVVIAAGECEVTILPRFGGKIASIRLKGRELLQQPLAPIELRTRTMGFDESDASGWDECLPSVAPCSVPYADGVVKVPDHGDLWRVAWEQRDQRPDLRDQKATLTLTGKCFSLPLELERTIELGEAGGACRLELSYKLTNTGNKPVSWSWSAHPLFAVSAGDRIVLPEGIRTLRLEGSGGKRLGIYGDMVHWPIAKLGTRDETFLNVAQPADSGIGDKLFAGPLTADENWCELVRPDADVKIRVSFDTEKTPYLGLWICYGGWPQREGPKQMCVALEPTTAPVDSLAVKSTWSRVLAPGESYDWPMIVEIEPL
jgi:galactose mutarotase-like enzyme